MPAFAGTFYVRPDGNDSNPGTANTPSGAWATIQKAADTLTPGDTVEIQSGTYNEAVKITNSGTPDQYIVFRANGEVIINAKGPSIKLDGANYIRLEGLACKSTSSSGISLVNSNNNILVRNVSSSTTAKGIEADAASGDNQLIGNITSQGSSSGSISTIAAASPVSDSFLIPTAAGSISGTVTLQSRTNHQGLITFRLTIPGESTPFMTYEVTTASDGSYSLTDVPPGIYNLSAKHQIFLRQNQVLIEVIDGQTTPNINFTLLGGDADNNNVVNAFDNSILNGAFGSIEGSPRWDARADFDNNKVINAFDNSILNGTFGKSGAEPQITITSPQGSTFTNASSITVSGTINDNACQVTVNNISAQVANNTFTVLNVPLIEGQNRIAAIATNTKGIKNADLHIVTLDTIAPPQPTIDPVTSPTDVNYQTITGTKTEDTATIEVICPTATVGEMIYPASTTWSCPLTNLTPGDNNITVTAFDSVDNSSIPNSTTIVYQPQTGLTIDITSHENGDRVNTPTITVSGTVSDNAAQVKVNGIDAIVIPAEAGIQGIFTASGIPLVVGTNPIIATATKDTLTDEDPIEVILDQDPPSINIYTPGANSTTRSNIVYGRVSDDVKTVTVNGTPADVIPAEAGIQARFIARPTLTEGPNTIIVEATDKAGNPNQASVNITYNTQTPKVTITSPLDNSTQNISPINVQGTNTEDLSFIMVNSTTASVIPAEAGIQDFTAEGVTLDTTKSVITATGYDATDNKFQDAIVVNSPNLSHYELTKGSGDAAEDDPERPSAGSNQILKVRLEKNGLPAQNEEIIFSVQGSADGEQETMSFPQSFSGNPEVSVFTDINGEAQVTLTTDTNSDITNEVRCSPTSNPLVKTTFYIDTKPALPSILTKITDDSVTPVPGATIPLIVKLTDSNNNPIQDENINFQVISGDGILSGEDVIPEQSGIQTPTNYYGEAKVDLTCPSLGLVLTQIQASSQTVPSVNVTFNITTSPLLTVTVDDLFNKIEWNAAKIQDQIVEVTVTTDDSSRPPISRYKTWEKGKLFKVQDMSTGKIYIQPQITYSTTLPADRQIIAYDSNTDIYVVKIKAADQIEEKPYRLTYIDYSKGVIIKTESHSKMANIVDMLSIAEMADFIQLPEANNAWVYNRKTEKMYQNQKLIYVNTGVASERQVNTGISDLEFQ